jgi:hypothetical protein
MDLLDDNGDENLLTHILVDDAPPHQVVPQNGLLCPSSLSNRFYV